MKHKAAVLVAEDEPQARESLCQLLSEEGYAVEDVSNGNDALQVLSAGSVEAALLDIRMPGKDGLAVLRELRRLDHTPAVLVMTAFGTSSVAIEAMALGAFDYLTKPLNFDELLIQLDRAIENRRRIRELEGFRNEETAALDAEIIGSSPPMQELYKLIGQVSATDSTVMIRGESGTGKELVARAIHRHSTRSQRRLVTVDCASIPAPLLEAELFGHERGAFTGATQRRIGKFEYANSGTIFLDEIGELAPQLQAKLLRVLQERVIERLGSNVSIPLDVRVIAATNRDLDAAVRDGEFREDLYYRLNVVTLTTPPLRDRRSDIPELAAFLLERCAARLKLPSPQLSDGAQEVLCRGDWPGNVRELEHALERGLILSHGGLVTVDDLDIGRSGESAGDPFDRVPLEEGFHPAVKALERRLIERALWASGGNKTRAAEVLRINRRLLYDKLKEFGLE